MATIPTNASTVVIDDTNPALVYSGSWVRGGVSSEYNVTTHGTTQKGATLQYSFRGTSVSVYGTIGTDTPTSTYTIDGSTPSVFAAGKESTFVYQQLFFHSPTLADAEHTLLVTNTGSGELWIDFLVYIDPSPASSSTSSSLLPSTTLSLQPTFTSHTVTLTTSQAPNPDTPTPIPTGSGTTTNTPDQINPSSKSSIPAPAVAGAAIGVLVLIITLIFGLLYYRKRAKQLAGEDSLEKNNAFDPPASGKAGPGAPITPFTSAYAPSPHTPFGYGSSNTDMYLPSPVYPPSDYGYQNQSQPSTPIYHFSNHYPLGPGYSASSENIAGVGTGLGYGGMNHPGSQHGGTQYGYPISVGQQDYLQNPHSPSIGFEQNPYTSSDRLAVPERRNSLESAESHASLAYLSGDRVAMNPSSPLPDAVPGPPPTQATPQQSEKGGFIVYNPEIRQHEDGGVRLDVERPPGSGSQQQVVDVPPVYKPNY
ncbi:hypothetical protein BJ322DRAFT_616583 [Thelephora terrestris]|uniref:Transmembrane protein n=1 Tax=Thelephora terrestris TaxID=56493 RepID=A0A9P6L8N6_9AGAM|nr:hypothetical protein BJ322DRAFT_616583 [Thelephora terrestris]